MQDFISQNTTFFNWLLLPLLILVAKIFEVTVGTIRLILLARKEKKIAPMVAFVEVLIWIFTIGIIFKNLTNPMAYIAYAIGFAVGNYIGMVIEEKVAIGHSLVRIITQKDAKRLIAYLKKESYLITSLKAIGDKKQVSLIYVHLKRKGVKTLLKKIKRFNPRAFFSVQDVSMVKEGVYPFTEPVVPKKTPISKKLWGKSK